MSAVQRILRAALLYAQLALAVFPCRPRSKQPLTEHGFLDASKDPEVLRQWWGRWPDANVAIVTGAPSGIIVLDVDPRHGGDQTLAALEAKFGKVPEAPTVLTGGGGQHLYFRNPGGIRNSAGVLGPGLDIRGDGGYVVAPPSGHPSGGLYRWKVSSRIGEVALSDLPAWLLQLLVAPDGKPAPGMRTSTRTLPAYRLDLRRLAAGVCEGERDRGLFLLACFLRRRGYSRQQAEQITLDAAQRCAPPFPAREALRKVASAWRYAA